MNTSGITAAVVLAPVLMFGCAKQPATMATAAPSPTGMSGVSPLTDSPTTMQPVAHGEALAATAQRAPPTASGGRPAPSEFDTIRDLGDVHFDFDRYEIRARDAEILDGNAKWLHANANALVLIEGHCDQRGTDEYNLALGDRRAKAAMNYLIAHGIAPARMVTITYGRERPQCSDGNAACWAKNRRVHFLVKRM